MSMKATPNDQRSILNVAQLDQQANLLRHKAATLPELQEITSATVKFNNARDLRIAAETELSDVKRELLRAEADVEQVVSRITRDEARLAGGSASPKELEQLQHEVGTLGTRRAELEEVELEIMLRVDSIQASISKLSQEGDEQAAVIADLEIRKENALAAINSELETIASDRSKLVSGVEKSFLDLYEKIRADSGGPGAAALVAGTCSGCNLSINAVEIKRLSDLAEDEVVRCEECRCILVRGV
jgi:predicted  nucleic acid-binding Zn-ribbon protein